VAVSANGTVAVTYYDVRNLSSDNTTTLPTGVWLTTSPRGGAAFGPETHVAGSFNMLVAPNAGGLAPLYSRSPFRREEEPARVALQPGRDPQLRIAVGGRRVDGIHAVLQQQFEGPFRLRV
jgi:hypothetical protein